MLTNQYVLMTEPRQDFHCMEVYTNDGLSGYVIDFRDSFSTERARNDLVSVAYDREKGWWTETRRVARS
jgi:hypothetical protein